MFQKKFSTIRFFSKGSPVSVPLHTVHNVNCSEMIEFGMFGSGSTMLGVYGTDIDQVLAVMGMASKYLVVCCPKDERVDAEISKHPMAIWVDPSSVKETIYSMPTSGFGDSLLTLGEGGVVSVEFAKPKKKTKSKSKNKRAHNKDGTFKSDDPSTPENEAFEAEK